MKAGSVFKTVFKVFDAVLTWLIVLLLSSVGICAAYCVWDDCDVYVKAAFTENKIQQYKQESETFDNEANATVVDFSELREINPDIIGWITIDNTKIDYPLLQGESNQVYLNRNVFGEAELAGSIFMDSRNQPDLSDHYNLIYGHFMNGGTMFGSLAQFKDSDFFKENRSGMLYTENTAYKLEVFAVMVTDSQDLQVFDVDQINQDPTETILDYLKENALFLDEKITDQMSASDIKIAAMSTCSYEFSGARTIVFAMMKNMQE